MSQLSRLLRDEQFTPVGTDTALFVPPARKRMILRSAAAWERIGKRWFPTFAGVVLVEATKQIYAKPAPAAHPAPPPGLCAGAARLVAVASISRSPTSRNRSTAPANRRSRLHEWRAQPPHANSGADSRAARMRS